MWMDIFLDTCFLATNWPGAPTLYIVDWLNHYIKGEPHGTPPTPLKVKLILLKHSDRPRDRLHIVDMAPNHNRSHLRSLFL